MKQVKFFLVALMAVVMGIQEMKDNLYFIYDCIMAGDYNDLYLLTIKKTKKYGKSFSEWSNYNR